MPASNRRGYTLIELVITVLIIGILTAIAVPQYLQTVETGKADDAVSTVNMIGTTNKMFALDHGGVYVSGPFPSGGPAACGTSVTCPLPAVPAPTSYPNACYLVACKYLADQDWGSKPYVYTAMADGIHSASAVRATTGPGGTTNGTYSLWGYSVALTGQITANNGAPPPTY